jgi:hypothetical protein
VEAGHGVAEVRAKRTDGNHAMIRDALKRCGFTVFDTHELGGGFPDLAVYHAHRAVLLEVKDPAQPPSKRRLTPAEKEFHARWNGVAFVVETVAEAIAAIGVRS